MARSRLLNYVEDRVGLLLGRVALPIVLGGIGLSAAQLVGIFFIGRLGTTALGVISLYIPVMYLCIALTESFQISTQVSVAVTRGQRRDEELPAILSTSLTLSVAVTALVSAGVLSALPRLAGAMGADPDVAALFRIYVSYVLVAQIATIAATMCNATLRAIGDVRVSMLLSFLNVGVTACLYPVFIFSLHQGIAGAGMAAVSGAVISLACSSLALLRHRSLFPRGSLRVRWAHPAVQRYLMRIGLPVFVAFLVMFVSTFLFDRVVAMFGVQTLAGFGVAYRLQMMVLLPATGIGEAMRVVMGQNLGARRPLRVWQTFLSGLAYTTLLYVAVGLGVWFGAPYVVRWFAPDEPAVAAAGIAYLKTVGPTYVFAGIAFVVSSTLETMSKGVYSLILIVAYYIGLVAVPGLIFARALGAEGFFRLIAWANVSTLSALAVVAFWLHRALGLAVRSRTADGRLEGGGR